MKMNHKYEWLALIVTLILTSPFANADLKCGMFSTNVQSFAMFQGNSDGYHSWYKSPWARIEISMNPPPSGECVASNGLLKTTCWKVLTSECEGTAGLYAFSNSGNTRNCYVLSSSGVTSYDLDRVSSTSTRPDSTTYGARLQITKGGILTHSALSAVTMKTTWGGTNIETVSLSIRNDYVSVGTWALPSTITLPPVSPGGSVSASVDGPTDQIGHMQRVGDGPSDSTLSINGSTDQNVEIPVGKPFELQMRAGAEAPPGERSWQYMATLTCP